MNILDILVLAVLAVGGWMGSRDGLVKSACTFAGFFAGLLLAYTFYLAVGERLAPHLGKNAQAAPIVAFVILWLAVPIAMSFAGTLLTKFIDAIFLGTINKVGGAAFGVMKYFLGATLVLYALLMMHMVPQSLVDDSFFGDKMIALAEHVMEKLREVQSHS